MRDVTMREGPAKNRRVSLSLSYLPPHHLNASFPSPPTMLEAKLQEASVLKKLLDGGLSMVSL